MNGSGAEKQPRSPWIVDTSEAGFERDVFERSRERLVVVDFWAAWCQPCRLLGPILEGVAADGKGDLVLVKADTEKLADAPAQFGVRGIPAVFAVSHGEVVDSFVGLLPAESVRAWVKRALRRHAVLAARAVEDADALRAEGEYRRLRAEDASDAAVAAGLLRVLVARGALDEARALADELDASRIGGTEIEAAKAKLAIRGGPAEDIDALREEAEAKPADHALQLRLARALAGVARHEEALERAVRVVEADRNRTAEAVRTREPGAGEDARKLMLSIFLALPSDSDLTREYRRRLSRALY